MITIALFLGMSEVVDTFGQRDPTRYFQIVDFIPSSKERRLPTLVLPESQPDRATVDQPATERAVIDATPNFTDRDSAPIGPRRLDLDEALD